MVEPKKQKRPLGVARLISGKCIACGARCQSECRVQAIEMNDKGEPVFNITKCTGCQRCIRICPATAIDPAGKPPSRPWQNRGSGRSRARSPTAQAGRSRDQTRRHHQPSDDGRGSHSRNGPTSFSMTIGPPLPARGGRDAPRSRG